jgi:hypothetical protein
LRKKFRNSAEQKPGNFVTKFQTKLWKWQAAKAAWFFVRVPHEESLQIKYRNLLSVRGWGSIPVQATIGATSWRTSIFPEKSGCYILPIKLEVRKKENLTENDLIDVTLNTD